MVVVLVYLWVKILILLLQFRYSAHLNEAVNLKLSPPCALHITNIRKKGSNSEQSQWI